MGQESLFEKMIDEETVVSNHGAPWTLEEEENLLKRVKENKTIDQISKEHKRTVGSIRGKLCNIAVKMHENASSISTILKTLKVLTNDDVEKALSREKFKKNKQTIKLNTNSERLAKIISIMNVLVSLELKRSGMTREEFLKLAKVDYENEIKKQLQNDDDKNPAKSESDSGSESKSKTKTKSKPKDKSDSESESEDEFEWKDNILDKIKKHINDENEIKNIKKKYNIPEDAIKQKIKEIKKKL